MKAFLNVGGGSKELPIPPHYNGWRQDRLDIDPAVEPDICLDARQLTTLAPATYDAVLCSHNLEHYHRHDGLLVLRGFHHVLKPTGFVEIRVPDIGNLFRQAVQRGLDLDDVYYETPLGPILVRDALWGYHPQIERTGQDFFGHKTGFTHRSLLQFLSQGGFPYSILADSHPTEIIGFFFTQTPTDDQLIAIGAKKI